MPSTPGAPRSSLLLGAIRLEEQPEAESLMGKEEVMEEGSERSVCRAAQEHVKLHQDPRLKVPRLQLLEVLAAASGTPIRGVLKQLLARWNQLDGAQK